MEGFLIGLVIGLAAAGVFYVQVRRSRGRAAPAPAVVVQSFITGARAVAELSVYRIRTKEIITTSDHWLGAFGKRYLGWLFSEKQMTMIFAFVIDFRYNLQSPEFAATGDDRGGWRVTLPPPNYDVQILDVLLHSEGKTELLPWLMPDIIGRFFTGGFSVEDKNRLIAEAKAEAARLAEKLVEQYQNDARASARRTLEMMARGFGIERIAVDFAPAREFRPAVDATRIEKALPAPGPGGGETKAG